MKTWCLTVAMLVLAAPISLSAFDSRDHEAVVGTAKRPIKPGKTFARDMKDRLGMPLSTEEIIEQAHQSRRASKRRPRRPHVTHVTTTTVVNEITPVIVVEQKAPEPAATKPEIEREWVPPEVETVTEPGYWDYTIKRTWMGDHWRYEQDLTQKTWVPPTTAEVVKREGYWRIVE